MMTAHRRAQLTELARSLRLGRELEENVRRPREQLLAHQRERLDALVRHAIERSPLQRERLGATVGAGPVELGRLPVLERAEMMARYDELVTDRRLRRDELLAWIEQLERDDLYLGCYRAMTTSGSSGRRGLFVYDREGWRAIVAQFLRFNEMAGVRPRLPRRLRIAAITAAAPSHMSRQVAASVAVGMHRILTLDVTAAVERLVEDLNRFRPDVVHAFPAVAARLAEEQTAGRLRIAPAVLTTASDLRTPEMVERMSEAFGVDPFDLYGTTEGLWACECDRHRGMHVFEDATIIENVDADGRPVPPGEPGARLLVTNFYNRVQPIIRLAVADALTIDPEPCPCGRTLLRIRSIDGRSDDVLELPGAGGRRVTVHPLRFAVVVRDREVREFQVVREETGICILVVPANGVGPGLEDRVRTAVAQRLGELGVTEVRISVERRDALERTPSGKLQMVVDRSRSPHDDHVAALPTGRERHGGYE